MYRKIKRLYTEFTLLQKDILAAQYLTPLSTVYLPWSQSAIRPSALVAIINEIVFKNTKTIVECGGGVSTFYIAKILKEKGGHLYTIESDLEWFKILNKEIELQNLSEHVTIIFAPLVDQNVTLDGKKYQWYDTQKIVPLISNLKIEMLLVDGPKAYIEEIQYSRYPALAYLRNFLSDDYVIILDDINRIGEQTILSAWEKELGIQFERRFLDGNIAIGRPRESLTV